MTLDFLASESHYADHLIPIWLALDPSERGEFFTTRRLAARFAERTRGIPRTSGAGRGRGPIVVAGFKDARHCRHRPIIFVEHGAGQSYLGADGLPDRNPSNPGGRERDSVVLFLCPNESVAARNREWYSAPAVVVGSPRMDRHHLSRLSTRAKTRNRLEKSSEPETLDTARTMVPLRGGMAPRRPHKPEVAGSIPAGATRDANAGDRDPVSSSQGSAGSRSVGPVVALSFHFDGSQCPETRWAFPHYQRALQVMTPEFTFLGHGHPRAWRQLAPFYEAIGIETVADFDEVLERADVYACDNSSSIVEFASIGKPVVFLNCPDYRRDVHHGGRFWDWPAGQVQCENPENFIPAIFAALDDPRSVRAARERMVEKVFVFTDGHAAQRAVDAIRSHVLLPARPG